MCKQIAPAHGAFPEHVGQLRLSLTPLLGRDVLRDNIAIGISIFASSTQFQNGAKMNHNLRWGGSHPLEPSAFLMAHFKVFGGEAQGVTSLLKGSRGGCPVPRLSAVPTCLGCHHEGRVPVFVLLVDIYVGALLQQGHDINEALVAGDHQPVLERGRHSAPGLVLHHRPHCGAAPWSPHPKPDRLRMGQQTRFYSKDWINPRRLIPCQSHPTRDSPSCPTCFSNHRPSGFAYSREILFLLCRVPMQPLTLPLTSSSVASLRVTPCSSLSCTSLASFLAQHW